MPSKGGKTEKGEQFKYKFGWAGPSTPDLGDLKHMYQYEPGRTLPASVDLSPGMPAVYAQGDIGSCGPNSLAAMLEYQEKRQGFVDAQTPSRLFLYYETRVLMGTVNEDSGVHNRTLCKAMANNGYCEEKEFWPYVTSKYKQKPPQPAYTDAKKSSDIRYQKVPQTLDAMKQCLADGNPILFGHMVYPSYLEAPDGDVPYPGTNERPVGGHDVVLIGYRDDIQRFTFQNSWGFGWGRRGRGTFPYNYGTSLNLSSDFWTIKLVPQDSDQPTPPPGPTPGPDWKKILEIIKRIIEAILGGNKANIKKAVMALRKEGCDEAIIAGILEYAKGKARSKAA